MESRATPRGGAHSLCAVSSFSPTYPSFDCLSITVLFVLLMFMAIQVGGGSIILQLKYIGLPPELQISTYSHSFKWFQLPQVHEF